jgi:hypothetical protein
MRISFCLNLPLPAPLEGTHRGGGNINAYNRNYVVLHCTFVVYQRVISNNMRVYSAASYRMRSQPLYGIAITAISGLSTGWKTSRWPAKGGDTHLPLLPYPSSNTLAAFTAFSLCVITRR